MSQASAGFPWFIVLVVVIGFLPGVLLLIVGRRGKRIDDHPVCRGCGFDLVGTVEPIPDKHPRCPECGTRREPRIGNRKRRSKLIGAGVVLMLLSIGVAGVWGYGRFGATQIAQYKPMWLLRWEVRSSSSETAEIALSEIHDRWVHGRMSTAAEMEHFFDDAIAYGPAGNPALANAPLGGTWNEIIGEMLQAGNGTDSQRLTIAKSWASNRIEARPYVRLGRPVPLHFYQKRFGPDIPSIHIIYDSPSIIANGGKYELHESFAWDLNRQRGNGMSGERVTATLLGPSHGLPPSLEQGVHEFEIEVAIRITNGYGLLSPVMLEWVETYPVKFEYVAEDGDPIKMIHNPEIATAFEKAVYVDQHKITSVLKRRTASTKIEFDNCSVPFAYAVFIEWKNQRTLLGTVSSEARPDAGLSVGFGGRLPWEGVEYGDVVNLVFVPDPEAARDTASLTEILDHIFVIEGVEIAKQEMPAESKYGMPLRSYGTP